MRPWLTGFLVRLKEETSDNHYPGIACIGYRLSAMGRAARRQNCCGQGYQPLERVIGVGHCGILVPNSSDIRSLLSV
jgi:hypothetical protein